MPAWPPKMRTNQDRRALGKLKATRGCKIEYPSQSTFLLSSKQGRFNGWAKVATNRWAALPWELRIRVERNDVLHFAERTGVSDDQRKPIALSAKKSVQVGEFSAFPLVTHPDSFLWVPATRPMKQEENIVAFAFVLFVERLNSFPCSIEESLVLWHHFGRGVTPIGQQAEMEMLITIGQVSDLQRLDQVTHGLSTGQHRGYGHERAKLAGNPVRKVHAGQGPWGHAQRHQPVDDGHAEVGCPQQNQECHRREQPDAGSRLPCPEQRGGGHGKRDRRGRPQIKRKWMPFGRSLQFFGKGNSRLGGRFELRHSLVDQKIPDVSRTVANTLSSRRPDSPSGRPARPPPTRPSGLCLAILSTTWRYRSRVAKSISL